MKQQEVLFQEDVVIENTHEEQDVKHILEVSSSWFKIACIFFSCHISLNAISLSPNKMLALGLQCAKVVQFPVNRMLWAHWLRNVYCFAFCCLVTGYLCVLWLWHPDNLRCMRSLQAAGQRALPKRTCKTKGQWKIREGQSLSSPWLLWKPFSCGKRRFRS